MRMRRWGVRVAESYEVNALQHGDELARLIEIVKSEGVRSYLEIGANFGGSLWRVGSVMPAGSRIVAVDLPDGTRDWNESSVSLSGCCDKLSALGHSVVLTFGDSTWPSTIESVKKFGLFDLVLIDANHTLPFVTKDWENYGPLGKIIAFHDIAWKREPEWSGVRIDVPQFWDMIKSGYRHEEIKLDPKGKDNGIGVLWRC